MGKYRFRLQNSAVATGGAQSGAKDDGNITFIGSTLYAFGGTDNNTTFNDMYRSVNEGVTWTPLANASWSIRNASAVFTRTGRFIVCGGKSSSTVRTDAWQFDGTTYLQLTATMTGFGTRTHFAFAQDDDYFYVIGGTGYNDVIRSADGITWTSISTLPVDLQDNAGLYCTKNKLNGYWYVHSGKKSSTYIGKLYKTADMITFIEVGSGGILLDRWAEVEATDTALLLIRGENDTMGGNQKGCYYSESPDDLSSFKRLPYEIGATHATATTVSADGTKVFTYGGNFYNHCWMFFRTDVPIAS